MQTVAPIKLLSDAAIKLMIAEFSKRKWYRNERDSAFASEAIQNLRSEIARRAA